ncbi:hypothetical protein AB0H86_26575 [Streptomyces sp. NPDC050997]|uniref:hypothetical protein n=1 Tax=Streptomyces sp. NPDC050997 TaxID=3155519 RepID=UPI00342C7FBB
MRQKPALGGERVICHDQAVVNLSKFARQADILLDLMGAAVGAMFLLVGIETYRDGGSLGWLIAGSVLFLINLWVAWRRFARRRKPTPSQ